MKKLILTREERTQAIIDGWRGLPGEFYMLKGLICLERAVEKGAEKKSSNYTDQRAERDQFEGTINMMMIAERMDKVKSEDKGGMKDEVIEVGGDKWKVREARSRSDALDAIAMARCTGSVGSRHSEGDVVTADVVRLNADGSERKPG